MAYGIVPWRGELELCVVSEPPGKGRLSATEAIMDAGSLCVDLSTIEGAGAGLLPA